jgi:ATP-binding cassette subfamily B protein
MSAVERLEGRQDTPKDTAKERESTGPESAIEALAEEVRLTPSKGRAPLRPLLALAPYVARYRGRVVLALISLTVAAITTLVVPVAVRRMIDFGFSPKGIALINNYFSVMIAVVAILALASASRYYLVMTIGERIVADLRRDVFAHLMSLSPAFFDTARSGELISRLTADTTQIKSAVGASVSIALRNLLLFFGAVIMMVITSPRLSGLVLLAIPLIVLPLVAFGRWVRRLSRNAQDTLADATAYASELVGAIRTVQAYTGERLADRRFRSEVEQAYEAARLDHHLHRLYQRDRDPLDRIARCADRRDHARASWPVRALRGLCRFRPRPAQRSLGRGLRGVGRGGAAVRNPAGRA